MRASLIASLSHQCRALTYSLTPFVPGSVRVVGNNRSTGNRGLRPIIKKYGEYPVIWDPVEL